jgi:hypothetical protein
MIGSVQYCNIAFERRQKVFLYLFYTFYNVQDLASCKAAVKRSYTAFVYLFCKLSFYKQRSVLRQVQHKKLFTYLCIFLYFTGSLNRGTDEY